METRIKIAIINTGLVKLFPQSFSKLVVVQPSYFLIKCASRNVFMPEMARIGLGQFKEKLPFTAF